MTALWTITCQINITYGDSLWIPGNNWHKVLATNQNIWQFHGTNLANLLFQKATTMLLLLWLWLKNVYKTSCKIALKVAARKYNGKSIQNLTQSSFLAPWSQSKPYLEPWSHSARLYCHSLEMMEVRGKFHLLLYFHLSCRKRNTLFLADRITVGIIPVCSYAELFREPQLNAYTPGLEHLNFISETPTSSWPMPW